jgi:Domain of unknown function (DUF4395)
MNTPAGSDARTRTFPERARGLFSFPNPVNEVSARLVAAGVLVMAILAITLDVKWLVAVLAYGFVARVLTGPTLSPLGQLVTRVVTPRLPIAPRPVAGPPKRFAQGMGAAITLLALGLTVAGAGGAAQVVLGLLCVAAFLESALGFCLGCRVFSLLIRMGLVPEEVCARCADIWAGDGPRAAPTP